MAAEGHGDGGGGGGGIVVVWGVGDGSGVVGGSWATSHLGGCSWCPFVVGGMAGRCGARWWGLHCGSVGRGVVLVGIDGWAVIV